MCDIYVYTYVHAYSERLKMLAKHVVANESAKEQKCVFAFVEIF